MQGEQYLTLYSKQCMATIIKLRYTNVMTIDKIFVSD